MQCILGPVEGDPLPSCDLSQQVVHHLQQQSNLKTAAQTLKLLRPGPTRTHVIVGPQLQTAGADPENTGEELVQLKEPRRVKVLSQVRELSAQVSGFLQRQNQPEENRTHSPSEPRNSTPETQN